MIKHSAVSTEKHSVNCSITMKYGTMLLLGCESNKLYIYHLPDFVLI